MPFFFFFFKYWSGLPFPSPGDLPNPGVFCIAGKSLMFEPPGKSFTDEKTEASKGKVTETLLLRSHLRFRPPLKRTLTPEGAQAFQGLSHATAPPHHLSHSHLKLQARYTPQKAMVMQFSDRESQFPTPFHGQLPLCLLQEASRMPSTLVRCLL